MLRILPFCLIFLCFSCSSKISQEKLTNLNGYWEIKTVTFKDGFRKEYKVNTTVDFIKIDSLKGYRKKMYPKFNGTYDTSNDVKNFYITTEENTFIFNYKTKITAWKEELLSLSKNEFSVKNEQDKIYTYQRYTPINSNQ